MKYFKDGDILLSDFDGVFLDSQTRFKEVMQEETALNKWMDYLSGIKWREFLHECNLIEGADEVFTELQRLEILKGIITRIHSFKEGEEKCLFLRELGIEVPIIYVLPEQPKNKVYIPNRKIILLDDYGKNCEGWEKDGGKSILYAPDKKRCGKKYVKSLYDLLK